MPVRIIDEKSRPHIPAAQMKDGQLARIVAWVGNPSYVGRLVERYGEALITVGKGIAGGWNEAFTVDHELDDDCRVEIIPNGIINLEVFDNE